MKKTISILLIIIIFIGILPTNISFAEDSSFLISVGTGDYAITVTINTTVNDIISVLGQPKITTPSAFGGHAYTFYTDHNYSNYLYIETTANDEKIISYGSVDPSFKTNHYAYGDKANYSLYTFMGAQLNDNGYIKGSIEYNREALINGRVADTIKYFEENYKSNPTYYLKGISEQTVTMYNATSTALGNKTNLIFDEDYFYMNEQLKEFGTSIREYIWNMDKGKYAKPMQTINGMEIANKQYYVINPMQWAQWAKNYRNTKFGDKNILIIDFDLANNVGYIGAIDPKLFEETDKVDFTDEELEKLNEGRQEYKKAMEYFAIDGNDAWVVEPQTTEVSSLVAGELKQSKKDAAISFLNCVRAGAGLDKYKWDEEAYEVAQYKSALLEYRKKVLNLEIAHSFSKPEGVSDEFYYKAMCMDSNGVVIKSYAENCSWGSGYSSVNAHIQNDIISYLDDSANAYGLGMGHRLSLLDPKHNTIGMAVNNITGAQEINSKNVIKRPVASPWPADGITFMESLKAKNFYWNIKFYENYKTTDTTKVKVTQLNTKQVWEFIPNSLSDGQYMKIYDKKSLDMYRNQIVWKDNTLNIATGDCYQIEISNLENATTGELETYSYRTRFEFASEASANVMKQIENITIKVPKKIEKTSEGIYKIPNAEDIKLTAELDENAGDKAIKWRSSNPNIISVTQNGILNVKEISDEVITITAYSVRDNNVKDSIKVMAIENKKIPEGYKINLNYPIYQFNSLDESIILQDEYINSNLINWSSTNSNVATVDSKGKVMPKQGGFTYIQANAGEYGTYSCWIYVCMLRTLSDGSKAYPGDLDRDGKIGMNDSSMILTWGNRTNLTADEILIADLDGDGKVTAFDASLINDIYKNDIKFTTGQYNPITELILNQSSLDINCDDKYNLIATIKIKDNSKETTDSPKLIWKSSNTRIATVDSNGNVTGVSGGKAVITVTASSGTKAICEVTVNGPVDYLPGDVNGDGKVSIIDVGLVNDHVKNKKNLTGEQLERADVDGNGKVSIIDVGLINDHVKNKKLLW